MSIHNLKLQSEILFTSIMKRRGPRFDPWGHLKKHGIQKTETHLTKFIEAYYKDKKKKA